VVVLSSSLGTTLELWEWQAAALAERCRVLRYDHRGHDGSSMPDAPWTVADLARDVLDLLDEVEVEHASFCGLSLGGAVGMWLGANASERVERLVLACTSTRFGQPAAWHERAQAVRRDGVGSIVPAVLGRWFTEPFRDSHPAVVARFGAMLAATPSEGYARCCEALAAWDFDASLAAVAAPTLVIAGAHDPTAPPAQGELIAAGIPDARLVVLEDAAHLANVEQPEAFTRALLAFAADREERT
jgi:3-oxoadipate enol-lactonase